jgi:hypothetical protein
LDLNKLRLATDRNILEVLLDIADEILDFVITVFIVAGIVGEGNMSW